jgi:hypothetical protein
MSKPDGHGRTARPLLMDVREVIRPIPLRRRRSRVPWIYSVYHARVQRPEAQNATSPAAVAESAATYGKE